jgi:16S rRNA G966 N2-methylase RsmD
LPDCNERFIKDTLNNLLLSGEVQAYISSKLNDDLSKILLGKSPFAGVSSKEIAEQVDSKKRAEKKLPTWYNSPGIYYPPKLSIEQSSSEITAKYKSTLIKGNTVIDLTGGLGVDCHYFSKAAVAVTHCELNPELSAIAQHNSKLLKTQNIRHIAGNGLEYLTSSDEKFDIIYIDPSRRVNAQKVFLLQDCEPDVVSNLDFLLSKADRIIIKTAPLLDIQSGIKELKQVSEIHVVSVKNECKELLWIIDKDFSSAEPQIVCSALTEHSIQEYRFHLSDEKAFTIGDYSNPLSYIYEPDVSLLKAGCFKLITKDFPISKLHQHTHLYTSNNLVDFNGRTFRLKQQWSYKMFSKLKPIKQANLICRNFPLNAVEVKKKHKLSDGGDEYLLFTTNMTGELVVLNCERLV